MREGSYAEIRPGMRVVGRNGETIGAVSEVVVDQASGIFIGLAVKPNLFTHPLLVPGEDVERLHQDVVYVDALERELTAYNSPEERHYDTEQAFEESSS